MRRSNNSASNSRGSLNHRFPAKEINLLRQHSADPYIFIGETEVREIHKVTPIFGRLGITAHHKESLKFIAGLIAIIQYGLKQNPSIRRFICHASTLKKITGTYIGSFSEGFANVFLDVANQLTDIKDSSGVKTPFLLKPYYLAEDKSTTLLDFTLPELLVKRVKAEPLGNELIEILSAKKPANIKPTTTQLREVQKQAWIKERLEDISLPTSYIEEKNITKVVVPSKNELGINANPGSDQKFHTALIALMQEILQKDASIRRFLCAVDSIKKIADIPIKNQDWFFTRLNKWRIMTTPAEPLGYFTHTDTFKPERGSSVFERTISDTMVDKILNERIMFLTEGNSHTQTMKETTEGLTDTFSTLPDQAS